MTPHEAVAAHFSEGLSWSVATLIGNDGLHNYLMIYADGHTGRIDEDGMMQFDTTTDDTIAFVIAGPAREFVNQLTEWLDRHSEVT